METKTCTCTACGSTATSVHHTVTVPSFDDEGRWDGEDIIEYDEIICNNPDCNNGLEDKTDDLPF
jgi:hypothetical protein